MKTKVVNSQKISDGIHFIKCEKNSVLFEPGNCVDIINPKSGVKKPYSIASSPASKYLDFFVRVFPSDTGVSQYISTLETGDEIEIGEPFGFFTPGKDQDDGKYIYIATGTGVAPFRSALQYYEHKPHTILIGCRHYSEMLYEDPAALLYEAYSRESDFNGPKHVTGWFNKLPTDKPEEYTYYICGLEEMITSTTEYLIDKGIPWDKIQVEQFYYAQY
jgi:ferredoxin--NADP+ reductase